MLPVFLTEEDLKRPEPDEPRQLRALEHQVQHRELHDVLTSRSWRLTAPLRRRGQRRS